MDNMTEPADKYPCMLFVVMCKAIGTGEPASVGYLDQLDITYVRMYVCTYMNNL